jgi:heme A synthase
MKFIQFLAQSVKISSGTAGIPHDSAMVILGRVLDMVYFISGAVAVIVIILAGYTFTTAVYDQAKITQAKNSILYAVVGLVVVIAAFAITQFVMGRF